MALVFRRRRALLWAAMISLTAAACEVVLQACYYASAGDFLFRRTHPPIYEADETRCFKLRPEGGEAAALRFAGVPLIDATNKLVEAARKERMYYWLDIHLTPAGNRATADAVLKGLRELVLTV